MEKKDYYDRRFMGKYEQTERELEGRERISIEILADLPLKEGSSFVDIGCGDGFFLQQVSNALGKDVICSGGEYSSFQRSKAVERTGYSIATIDLEGKLGFDDASFDVVYSGEVIEHLYNPDNMVKELNRIMKLGGYCLITTPNMNSWISRLFFPFGMQPINYECSTVSIAYGYGGLRAIKRQDWPVGHVRMFNIHSIRDILRANGFEVIKAKGAVFEFMPRAIPWMDHFFTLIPGLSSGLVVLAKKVRNNLFQDSSYV